MDAKPSAEVEIINRIVKIGEIATQPITDKWFYWAMLTFILHHRDWRYANFDIAMLMWVVHSLSLVYSKFMTYHKGGAIQAHMTSEEKWKEVESPSILLSYLSEVIGDWYVVFILKQIVDRRKYGLAALFCLLSSIVKLLIGIRLVTGYDDCSKYEGKSCFEESNFWREYQKLECLNILTTFLYYGICLIILLRHRDEYESQKRLNPSSYTIVKRFRRDSKYRMILSCIFAVISTVFALPFVYDTFKHKFDFRLEVTREAVMSLSYYMIYIDQILKSEQKGGQAFRSTSNGNSTSNYSSGNNTHNKIGFSSKGALDSSKIHDLDYGATPWSNNSGNYNINNNYNNYNNNSYSYNNY